MASSWSTVLAITSAKAAFCTAVSMPRVTDWLRDRRAAHATPKPTHSMLMLSSSANGARVVKLSRRSAQFLATASTTMSTNSTVATRVARGSKRCAQALQRWRANMPRLTGTPSTSATWPIINPTGTSTARAAPR